MRTLRNDYDKTIEVKRERKTHIFDSFEGAIPFRRRNTLIAVAGSSVTASRAGCEPFVAPIARAKAANAVCAIASDARFVSDCE
jgi:hypothetical protein